MTGLKKKIMATPPPPLPNYLSEDWKTLVKVGLNATAAEKLSLYWLSIYLSTRTDALWSRIAVVVQLACGGGGGAPLLSGVFTNGMTLIKVEAHCRFQRHGCKRRSGSGCIGAGLSSCAPGWYPVSMVGISTACQAARAAHD